MNTNVSRKLGRSAVGSWGRPTGKYQKRLAAKAVRRALAKESKVKIAA